MKATTLLCPVLTLLCATKLVYTAQRGSYGRYPLDDMDSQMLQNDYFLSKRNKPSLSIVNPLDVLRQRLLLEIARRQMKENTRQVELNRAILKNVGKRMVSKYPAPLTAALYDAHELQQLQQQQQQLESMQNLPPSYEYELIPTTLIFDYLQKQQQQLEQEERRPWLPYESTAIQFDNNYINDAAALSSPAASRDDVDTGLLVDGIGEQNIIAYNGELSNNDKHSMKHIKQSNNEHSSNAQNEQHETATFQKSINDRNDKTKRLTMINNRQLHHHKNDLNLDLNDANTLSSKSNANDYKSERNDNGGDYQIQRYLYHLHKNQNHLTRK